VGFKHLALLGTGVDLSASKEEDELAKKMAEQGMKAIFGVASGIGIAPNGAEDFHDFPSVSLFSFYV
jgi:hypothetical protein